MSPETPVWVRDAVFYQVFPDRFARSERVPKPGNLEPWDSPPTPHGFKGGDLLGLAEKLDDLAALGVTALYLNPVFASAANHRYHTWDYHQVDPILGGNEALRELLDAAHARGMRVVLDGVFNHVGRGFFAFHSVLENGADSPYLDWFHLDVERLRDGRPLGAYAEPKLLRRSKRPKPAFEELGYSAWWDCPALPKLDTRTRAVREYLWDVAERWVRFGIDGWRLDVPAEIDDDEFWRELRRRVKRANPEAYLVGEIWHDARRWLAGDQFDATMNYPLAKAALGFFLPELETDALRSVGGYRDVVELDAAAFAAEVERVLALYHPAVRDAQLNLIGSHDTPRFLTLAGGELAALEMAFLFLFTLPGAPCIYYGDEIGLEGGPDPDCRRTYPWDEGSWDHVLREQVRRLAALRRAHPALRRGSFRTILAEDAIVSYVREEEGGDAVVVAFNVSREERRVDLPVGALPERLLDAATGDDLVVTDGELRGIDLPGRSGRAFVTPPAA
ncbi:MAG: glycoside hydrolase family 13 protein [Thermoanaerobaculia bacterium]|nr:glycoside hydrolase family 13 protein [Thermoanaerobaculia bacterium]